MPRPNMTERYDRMSKRATKTGFPCLTCTRYTANRGRVCEGCLKPAKKKKRPKALSLDLLAHARLCVRCEMPMQKHEVGVCAACAIDMEQIKADLLPAVLERAERDRDVEWRVPCIASPRCFVEE